MSDHKNEDIYSRFVEELNAWCKGDDAPSAASRDVRFTLELQKEYLKKHNIVMTEVLTPDGDFTGGKEHVTIEDDKYTNRMVYSNWIRRIHLKKGKSEKSFKKRVSLYSWITRTKEENITGAESVSCPSCGAATTIKYLEEQGCPYCGTKFRISQLYPRITNFFYLKQDGYTDQGLRLYMGICTIAGIVTKTFSRVLPALMGQASILKIILLAFVGVISGAFTGFTCSLFGLMFFTFLYVGSSIPKWIKTCDTEGKISRLIKPYDPYFSYRIFEGKMVNLIKIIIFGDEESRQTVYANHDAVPNWRIVDITYESAISLDDYKIQDGYCTLDLGVYLRNIWMGNTQFKEMSQVCHLQVKKNLNSKTEAGFSITHIQCPSCGASFDATKQKYCPYCKNEYQLQEDDWVVMKIW